MVWFVIQLVSVVAWRLEAIGQKLDAEKSAEMLTRLAVAQHVLRFAIVTGGVIYALSQFDWFSQMGMGLLASAQIVGLVEGSRRGPAGGHRRRMNGRAVSSR